MGTSLHVADALLLGLYPAALCAAIGTDLWRRVIPNGLVVVLVAGFGLLAALTPLGDLPLRLVLALAATAAGFCLFAQDLIGAGDAKLAGALMLWVDPGQIPLFMLACAVIGVLLTLAATLDARHPRLPAPVAALVRAGRTLPYGVALAGAGLALHPYSSLMGAG